MSGQFFVVPGGPDAGMAGLMTELARRVPCMPTLAPCEGRDRSEVPLSEVPASDAPEQRHRAEANRESFSTRCALCTLKSLDMFAPIGRLNEWLREGSQRPQPVG